MAFYETKCESRVKNDVSIGDALFLSYGFLFRTFFV